MASIRQTPNSPFWQAVLTLEDGSRTNRSTKQRERKKAQDVADQWQAAYASGRAGKLAEGQIQKVFNDLLERVGSSSKIAEDTVDEYLRRWVKGKANLNTRERYSNTVDLFLEFLGRRAKNLLGSIGYKDIQGFIELRQQQGFAPKTIFVDVKSLNNAFSLARRTQIIAANPVEKALALVPLSSESSQRKTLTDAQVNSLLAVATDDWKTMLMLAYYTGARLTDLANMRWDNVKQVAGLTLLDYIPTKTKKAGKTPERVVLPMHPTLADYLETIQPRFSEFVCPRLAGRKTGGAHGLSAGFQVLLTKAGIDCQKIAGKGKRKFSQLSFHSFRHTFNSNLANKNVNQETRMVLTGHKTEAINSDYTHLDLPKLHSAIATLPALKIA